MPSVVQAWVEQIPLRMQSTLLLGLRGPDTHRCPELKRVVRWLRGITFRPANPANVAEFMGSHPGRIIEKSPLARELEFCTQHYYSHLLHALEVVAYRHPKPSLRTQAYELFFDLCTLFHLPMESANAFERRLRNLEWPGGQQPDTFDEAMRVIELFSPRNAPLDK